MRFDPIQRIRLQDDRSRQGKMEKSLLSFAATYPDWLPGPGAAELLSAVGPAAAALHLNGAFHTYPTAMPSPDGNMTAFAETEPTPLSAVSQIFSRIPKSPQSRDSFHQGIRPSRASLSHNMLSVLGSGSSHRLWSKSK